MGEGRKERERDKSRNRLLTRENTLMVTRGEVGGGMGEMGVGLSRDTCGDGHLVSYGRFESLHRSLETNILHVN